METDQTAGAPQWPGDIVAQFSPELLDETACRSLVLQALHSGPPACPTCSVWVHPDLTRDWHAGKRIRCRNCKRSMSATSATILDGLHLTFSEVVMFLALVSFDIPDRQIAAILDRDRSTVTAWRRRLIPETPGA